MSFSMSTELIRTCFHRFQPFQISRPDCDPTIDLGWIDVHLLRISLCSWRNMSENLSKEHQVQPVIDVWGGKNVRSLRNHNFGHYLARLEAERLRQWYDLVFIWFPWIVVRDRIETKNLLFICEHLRSDSTGLLTLITATVYFILSRSWLLNSVSPRASTWFHISTISLRSFRWTSGWLASSWRPQARVCVVDSWPALSIVLRKLVCILT